VSEALDTNPPGAGDIFQVLGHDSIETTLRFHIHIHIHTSASASANANAEQCVGKMMNARWNVYLSAPLHIGCTSAWETPRNAENRRDLIRAKTASDVPVPVPVPTPSP
jgi:hypothetical protein